MLTRRTNVSIAINNYAVTEEQIAFEMTSYTYTDPASDEADSLQLEFMDRNRKWIKEYFPHKLDMVAGSIHLHNYEYDGSYQAISTGALFVDSFSFSGHPNTMSMSCISTPMHTGFKETKNSKTYENATFQTICNDIASRNGLRIETNVDDFVVNSIEQKNQIDADFITSLCNEYGICIKIYTDKLIIFDREKYKLLPSVRVYSAEEIKSYSYQTQIEGSYDGGEYTYKDPITNAEIKAIYGNTAGRVLRQSGNAMSIADAERKIKGQVLNANHGITKMNITIMGEPIYSTQNIEIVGLGELDGKYYIDKATHSVSGGFTTTLDLSKCE